MSCGLHDARRCCLVLSFAYRSTGCSGLARGLVGLSCGSSAVLLVAVYGAVPHRSRRRFDAIVDLRVTMYESTSCTVDAVVVAAYAWLDTGPEIDHTYLGLLLDASSHDDERQFRMDKLVWASSLEVAHLPQLVMLVTDLLTAMPPRLCCIVNIASHAVIVSTRYLPISNVSL